LALIPDCFSDLTFATDSVFALNLLLDFAFLPYLSELSHSSPVFSESCAPSFRRCVLTQTARPAIVRPVESRFVILDTATLSLPAQLWNSGTYGSEVWYTKCLSIVREEERHAEDFRC
jgi:hypothetical protein